VQINKIQNFLQVIMRTEDYVVCKYKNFITSEIFQALFVSDPLLVKCQNTSCFGWSKPSF